MLIAFDRTTAAKFAFCAHLVVFDATKQLKYIWLHTRGPSAGRAVCAWLHGVQRRSENVVLAKS